MTDHERRQPADRSDDADCKARLRESLTAAQLDTLSTLEQFRWQLEFVRRPLFRTPVPVLRDREGSRVVVLEADGSISQAPALRLRGQPAADVAGPGAHA